MRVTTDAEIYWIPGPWRGRLGIVPRPRGGDWLADEVRSWRAADINVVASFLTPEEVAELELQDEEALCRREGIEYHSLGIPDRGVPASSTEAAVLIRILEQALEAGRNVAVHCRQSIGRSSLMVASILALAGEEPETAFRDIGRVRGVQVPETSAQRHWVEEFASAVSPRR